MLILLIIILTESEKMAGDSRKDFLLVSSANFFGVLPSDGAITSCVNDSALNTFLDDGGTPVLSCRMDGKKLVMHNMVIFN